MSVNAEVKQKQTHVVNKHSDVQQISVTVTRHSLCDSNPIMKVSIALLDVNDTGRQMI